MENLMEMVLGGTYLSRLARDLLLVQRVDPHLVGVAGLAKEAQPALLAQHRTNPRLARSRRGARVHLDEHDLGRQPPEVMARQGSEGGSRCCLWPRHGRCGVLRRASVI